MTWLPLAAAAAVAAAVILLPGLGWRRILGLRGLWAWALPARSGSPSSCLASLVAPASSDSPGVAPVRGHRSRPSRRPRRRARTTGGFRRPPIQSASGGPRWCAAVGGAGRLVSLRSCWAPARAGGPGPGQHLPDLRQHLPSQRDPVRARHRQRISAASGEHDLGERRCLVLPFRVACGRLPGRPAHRRGHRSRHQQHGVRFSVPALAGRRGLARSNSVRKIVGADHRRRGVRRCAAVDALAPAELRSPVSVRTRIVDHPRGPRRGACSSAHRHGCHLTGDLGVGDRCPRHAAGTGHRAPWRLHGMAGAGIGRRAHRVRRIRAVSPRRGGRSCSRRWASPGTPR